MSAYWVRFAAAGNPNGPDLPEWPAHDERSAYVKDFGPSANADRQRKTAPVLESFVTTRFSPR